MATNYSKTQNDPAKETSTVVGAADGVATPAADKIDAAPKAAAAETVTAQAASEAAPEETVETVAETVLEAVAEDPALVERIKHADTVILNNVYLSAAAGVIPFALVDTAALIAVQLKMLNELAKVHNVEFRANLGKSAVGSLLGSVTPTALAQGVAGTGLFAALTAVPVLGPTVRALTMPVFGAAFTYAVGKIFAKHFASGGTFLTFDASAGQAKFKETFEKAKKYRPFAKKPAEAAAADTTDVPADAVTA